VIPDLTPQCLSPASFAKLAVKTPSSLPAVHHKPLSVRKALSELMTQGIA
jgi:hypothetical protein